MPAIQPARLRQQAALVAEYFDQPASFVRSLHHLLEFYADHAQRPGQAGKPPPLLDSYRVRPPVLRQILQELVPLAQQDQQAALALCDALWGQPYLELHMLAASLLGQVPPVPAEPVLERIKGWLSARPESRLIDLLLNQGLARLRKDDPQQVIALVENWLEEDDSYYAQLGLRALPPLIDDPAFKNLPVFFSLILPLSRSAPSPLRPDLLDVIAALARRSPRETAYFLRQNLEVPDSPDTPWLIRNSLQAFPGDVQESLRAAVRGAGQQNLKA